MASSASKRFPACSVPDCPGLGRSGAAEYCEMHYGRIRRHGSTESLRRIPNGSCFHCGGPTPPQRVFCSAICSTRDRVGAHHDGRSCLICGESIAHQTRWGALYCSRSCNRKASQFRRYGITAVAFNAMLADQGGACRICRSVEKLVIDHDHATDKIRGLLCGGCNAGIGMLKEDPAILSAAIEYLA